MAWPRCLCCRRAARDGEEEEEEEVVRDRCHGASLARELNYSPAIGGARDEVVVASIRAQPEIKVRSANGP
jgi:hypothetical protein